MGRITRVLNPPKKEVLVIYDSKRSSCIKTCCCFRRNPKGLGSPDCRFPFVALECDVPIYFVFHKILVIYVKYLTFKHVPETLINHPHRKLTVDYERVLTQP